ncbi:TPA: Rha family transcriptional regulator [Escherichia coli]
MNTVTTMNTAVKTASVSLVVDNTKPLTMSTLQIAELTGKKHKHVMRDVRQMIESLELGSKLVESNSGLYYFVEKEYKAENGKSNPFYELDEDLCNTLVMGYDAPLRFKIAKEWRLMKEGKANVPVNPYEHFEETDWIELALKKTRENKQLIELHVRKSVDSHSMTRLFSVKTGRATASSFSSHSHFLQIKVNVHLYLEDLHFIGKSSPSSTDIKNSALIPYFFNRE